jgi:hypothetical protein
MAKLADDETNDLRGNAYTELLANEERQHARRGGRRVLTRNYPTSSEPVVKIVKSPSPLLQRLRAVSRSRSRISRSRRGHAVM